MNPLGMRPQQYVGFESGVLALRGLVALGLSLLFAAGLCVAPSASATPGPFAGFTGSWSGTGTIRIAGGQAERLRCRAAYRVQGSAERNVDLQLSCASDNYKFDLTGDFRTDERDQISGRWTERSRGVGGSVIGQVRGERVQVLVESSAFAAKLTMLTRDGRQTVQIDSQAAGESVQASITMRRDRR